MSPLQKLIYSTLTTRQRVGLSRQQILHRWRKSVIRSHPQLMTTDLFPEETKMLLDCLERIRPDTYLEIGVFWGGTLRNVIKQRDELKLQTKCIGIDIWDEIYDKAETTHGTGQPIRQLVKRSLEKQGFGNFELFTGLSVDIQRLISFKIDLAFHDANHTYAAVVEDLELLHPLMSDGATLLVHNAGKEFHPDEMYFEADGGPYQAIMDLAAQGKWKLEALEFRMAVLTRIP